MRPAALAALVLVACAPEPGAAPQPYIDHPLAKAWGFMIGTPPRDTLVSLNFEPDGSMAAIYLTQAQVMGARCFNRLELSGVRWAPASNTSEGVVTLDMSAMVTTEEDRCGSEPARITRTPTPGPSAQAENYSVTPSSVVITFRGETYTRAR
jgi:hypothetical protein